MTISSQSHLDCGSTVGGDVYIFITFVYRGDVGKPGRQHCSIYLRQDRVGDQSRVYGGAVLACSLYVGDCCEQLVRKYCCAIYSYLVWTVNPPMELGS